jgi:hypothetical protein
MKTEEVEELSQRTDYDNMSEDELRWLKDHNRLPAVEEAKHFRPVVGVGGPTVLTEDVPNTGDVNTVDMGVPPELRGTDLSLIDREAEKDRKIAELEAELEQERAERAALSLDSDSGNGDDEEFEEVDYTEMGITDLHEEIDERNKERAAADLEPLTKPRSKADSIAELERDDSERSDSED